MADLLYCSRYYVLTLQAGRQAGKQQQLRAQLMQRDLRVISIYKKKHILTYTYTEIPYAKSTKLIYSSLTACNSFSWNWNQNFQSDFEI